MITTIKLLLFFLWEQILLITLEPCKKIVTFLYELRKFYYKITVSLISTDKLNKNLIHFCRDKE